MGDQLTEEQKQALELDKNISVTAGAGSGKTKILTERFLKIALKKPKLVKNILAITFTKKAAGEMLERIAAEVQTRLLDSCDNGEKLRLHQIRDQLNSTYISTIHTFCSKILREFPIEAGIQPDFTVTEEIRNIIFKGEAVKYAFNWVNSLNKESSDYAEWLHLFTVTKHKRIKDLLNKALSNPFEMEKISSIYNNFNEKTYLEFIEDHWLKRAEKCTSIEDVSAIYSVIEQIFIMDTGNRKGEKGAIALDSLQTFHNSYKKGIRSAHMYLHLFKLVDVFTTSKGDAYKKLGSLGKKTEWGDAAGEKLLFLSSLCEPIAKKIDQQKPGTLLPHADREWFKAFSTFLHLYKVTNDKFIEIKREQNVLDYEDLQILTIHLLQDNPEVSKKLQKRFSYIMVDEFQDTNALQWEIINLLVGERSNLFVVGDPKQSIYGFRNADIRIFDEAKRSFAALKGFKNTKDYPGNIVFKNSFRFLPRLNDFINYIFENTLIASKNSPYEVGYHRLESKRHLPKKGWVELALIDTEDGSKSEEDYIALRIKQLITEESACYIYENGKEQEKKIKFGHIAILLRGRTTLLKLEESLRRKGIPFKTVGGIGFWQRQEIYDIYYLLRFLSNPVDDLALIAVLRSKLLMIPDSALFFLAKEVGETYMEKLDSGFKVNGYDDKELALLRNAAQLILKWLALRERVSLADLLKTIINDIHLKTVLSAELNGEQFVANIDKLINLADSFDSGGLGGLQDFLANINELINRETKEGDAAVDIDDEETVKIMTIHASKGLQFPVVFLPNLNPQNRGMKDSVFIDPALGLASVLTDIETDKNREHTLLNLLKALLIEKDLAEKKRIFYVAATRASNYLFMTAEYKKDKINDNTPLSWLENVFDINNPAKSFSENFGFEITRGYSTDFIDESSYIKKDFIDHLQRAVDKYKSKHDNIPSHLHSLKISQPAQTFSATKIMVFIKDKDEYYRRYHLGFFEDDYNTFAKDVYKSDHHLLRGSIIHKYLELKDSFNDENKLIDKIISDFDVFDLHLANNLKDDIKRLYKKMTDSSIGKRILNAKKYRNEAVINAHIGNDYLTGALDRIILNEDDLWEIVDYKTNKISLENLDREAKKYEWQIKTYAIFISRLYPEQEQYPISFYFLEIDHLYQVTFSHDEIIAMEVDIIKIMAEIKKTFPVR